MQLTTPDQYKAEAARQRVELIRSVDRMARTIANASKESDLPTVSYEETQRQIEAAIKKDVVKRTTKAKIDRAVAQALGKR